MALLKPDLILACNDRDFFSGVLSKPAKHTAIGLVYPPVTY
jgi:hypothetical protein